MILRPYQDRAIAETRAAYQRGGRRVVLVAPTGSGKTVIAVHMIRAALARGRRVAFVAHRRELITQASERLGALGIEHGIIQAGRPARAAPVQVCSIDSLRSRARPPAELVIVDEAHHTMAAGYRALLDYYAQAWVLGLTATPLRLDGRGLADVYQALVVVAQPGELIADGHLVEPRVFAPVGPSMRGVRRSSGDYAPGEAAERMATVTGDIAAHLEKHAPDVRAVIYCCTIAHSLDVAARIGAEHLDGMTPAAERDAILARLRAGATKRVCNVGVLTEGWDLPELGCVVLARPTKSLALYLQMCGRAMRPAAGKAAPIILDHAGNSSEHGHPASPREWMLCPTVDATENAPPTFRCRVCYYVSASPFTVCPACGAVREVTPREITEDDGELREVGKVVVSMAEKQAKWDDLAAVARRRGWKLGWAKHEYRRLFGVWPRGVLHDADKVTWRASY